MKLCLTSVGEYTMNKLELIPTELNYIIIINNTAQFHKIDY